MAHVLPDPTSEFGVRVRRRLTDEILAWFVTTGEDGTPQPNPVWFLWDGADSLLVYCRPSAHRLAYVAARPRVAVHLDGNGRGGDIVVLTGTAAVEAGAPAADGNAQYLAKYAPHMARVAGTPQRFAEDYSVALRMTITGIRGF